MSTKIMLRRSTGKPKRRSETVIGVWRQIMALRIIFDGLNLSLARGTGIATYTRMLTRAAHDLGHEVGVVYSTPFTPAKDPLLREIAFFDEKRPSDVGEAKADLETGPQPCHRPDPISPARSSPAGRDSAAPSSPGNSSARLPRTIGFLSPAIFSPTHGRYFSRTKAFVNLAFEPRPDILHCTYPLPLRVKSARNIYTIHDLVPLRLPFTTEDNKRQLFRLLKKIAREADHIVTVSENSKRDIIELLGVEEERITNTYQAVDFPQEWIERPMTAVANQLERAFRPRLAEYLLFYGALEPKKNVRRLIDAYLVSGVDIPLVLVVAGGWQNDAEMRLLDRAATSASGVRKRCRGAHPPARLREPFDTGDIDPRRARRRLSVALRGLRPAGARGDGSRYAGRRVARIVVARDRRRGRLARRPVRYRSDRAGDHDDRQ